MTIDLNDAAFIPGLRRAFRNVRRQIEAAIPVAEVVHTGASSVPGLLTRGDLDIHVRVARESFAAAAAILESMFNPHRREIWTSEFATYVDDVAQPPVGVALTAIGGEHDRRFMTSWRRLTNDRRLINEYNAMKRRHADDGAAYEAAKSAFFTRLAED